MKQYSDATQMVLERVLLLLSDKLPARSVDRIREAIERGTFLSANDILDSILSPTAEEPKNADK